MSNINKQTVQAVADLKAGYTLGHADVELIQQMALDAVTLLDELENTQAQSSKWCEAFHKAVSVGACYEERIEELESLTAGMEQEPVAWKYRLVELATEDAGPWKMCLAPMGPGRGAAYRTEVIPLYASPQLPHPSVPLVNLPSEFYSSEGVMVQLEKVMAALAVCGIQYRRKVNACRAAMIQGADGNSLVIPDGWKLVPIDPTKDMLRAGQSVVGFWLNTVHCYSKMLAAAPAAPHQEVK